MRSRCRLRPPGTSHLYERWPDTVRDDELAANGRRSRCRRHWGKSAVGTHSLFPYGTGFTYTRIRQIAAADVILLNKVDLVSPKEADATEATIRGINPAATLHRTVRGEIELKYIMGVDAYASRQFLDETRALAPATAKCDSHKDHDAHTHDHHGHDHPHGKEPTHYELRGISSLQIDCPKLSPVQLDKLDEWIRTVLWEKQVPGRPTREAGTVEVLRCKGLFVTESGELHVLQGVRNLYEISQVEGEEALGLPDTGKLVFIGKGLDEDVRYSLEVVLKNS